MNKAQSCKSKAEEYKNIAERKRKADEDAERTRLATERKEWLSNKYTWLMGEVERLAERGLSYVTTVDDLSKVWADLVKLFAVDGFEAYSRIEEYRRYEDNEYGDFSSFTDTRLRYYVSWENA